MLRSNPIESNRETNKKKKFKKIRKLTKKITKHQLKKNNLEKRKKTGQTGKPL
jgi:hypothetical protein